ncbi:response regulator transcription factor [Candidatus Microgenomates bacterium]|nr:response regulator transcription factor [Candidatus Microgenomates bacterium]
MALHKKILVVDDDPGILEVMAIILGDAGYDIETARSGDIVYDTGKDSPDLFLLDIWMSGRDGCTLCRYIKSTKQFTNVPVILVSANQNGAELARAARADDFIAKPFDIDLLLAKVAQYLPN